MTKTLPDRQVVFTDGTFDLMHHNHIEFLIEARTLGNYLLVGVVSDALCQTYKRIPVLSEQERLKTVQLLPFVDEAFVFPGPFSATVMSDLIETHNISAVVYAGKQDDDYYGEAERRGIMHRWPYRDGLNSSEIIRRIRGRQDL